MHALRIMMLLLFIGSLHLYTCSKSTVPIENEDIKNYTLGGSITDSENMLPVNDAILELMLQQKTDTTDPSGSYLFENLEKGTDSLIISADNYKVKSVILIWIC